MCEAKIPSPSGNHSIRFSLVGGVPHYSVCFEGTEVLSDSGLSLDGDGFTQTASKKGGWTPTIGSKSSCPDAYDECVVRLRKVSKTKRKLDLTFRAYDEGVAFRYTIPK